MGTFFPMNYVPLNWLTELRRIDKYLTGRGWRAGGEGGGLIHLTLSK